MAAITATRRLRNAQSVAVEAMRALREALREVGPEEVFRPDPWGDEDLEDFDLEEDWGPDEEAPGLEGLGNFFKKVAHAISNIAVAPIRLVSKKAADNLQKVDNKVIDAADKVWTASGDLLHKAGGWVAKRLGKNWKWIAIVIAIAITIYTMGAGATIMAHMISGMEALGHAIAAGAAAVGHGITTAATAVGHAVGIGTGAAAGTTAATGASASSGFLGMSAGTWTKLALTAGKALVTQRAKVSDLSQAQAQAVLQAQDSGYDMGANDPQLRQALETRAQIPGLGIPTDAYGNPLVSPSQVGAGILQPDGTVIPGGPTMTGTLVESGGGYGGGGGGGFGGSAMPSWLLPTALGGGLLLVLAMQRGKR